MSKVHFSIAFINSLTTLPPDHHRAQQALERAQALELRFFEKPTHYFHARCDPRHFSDTTFTSVSDPATGANITLDTPDGLAHAQRIIADFFFFFLI